jgi:putative nucleotidyltransferase with HDIG domain
MSAQIDIDKKLDTLPLLPDVVVSLLRLRPEDESYYDDILDLAKHDPTFTIQIIRLANSAANAPVAQIRSLEEAVSRIGANAIAGLITAMTVLRVFVPSDKHEKDLWVHSVQVAIWAQYLARVHKDLKIDPSQAYLCGLMHDIGRFAMFDQIPEEFKSIDAEDWHTPKELIDVEQQFVGSNHAQIGQKICIKWGLPESVRWVVGYHHIYHAKQYALVEKHDAQLLNLLKIIQVADRISMMTIKNDSVSELDIITQAFTPELSPVSLNIEQIKTLFPKINDECEDMRQKLNI